MSQKIGVRKPSKRWKQNEKKKWKSNIFAFGKSHPRTTRRSNSSPQQTPTKAQFHNNSRGQEERSSTPFLASTGCSSSMWQHSPTTSKTSEQNGQANSGRGWSSPPSNSSIPRYASTNPRKPQSELPITESEAKRAGDVSKVPQFPTISGLQSRMVALGSGGQVAPGVGFHEP